MIVMNTTSTSNRLIDFYEFGVYEKFQCRNVCQRQMHKLKRKMCFFVVVASTFNTQRLPGLFLCGKRYRSARLYLYKSEGTVTNLHLLRSWKQVGSKFTFNICMG